MKWERFLFLCFWNDLWIFRKYRWCSFWCQMYQVFRCEKIHKWNPAVIFLFFTGHLYYDFFLDQMQFNTTTLFMCMSQARSLQSCGCHLLGSAIIVFHLDLLWYKFGCFFSLLNMFTICHPRDFCSLFLLIIEGCMVTSICSNLSFVFYE